MLQRENALTYQKYSMVSTTRETAVIPPLTEPLVKFAPSRVIMALSSPKRWSGRARTMDSGPTMIRLSDVKVGNSYLIGESI